MTPPSTAGLALATRGVLLNVAEHGRAPRLLVDAGDALRWPARTQVALCGPSGSGKTSLLHMLAALRRPARGEVRWGAIDVAALDPAAADRWRAQSVGLVFQRFHLIPGLSAYENVVLPLRFRGLRVPVALAERADALLERLRIDPRARVERQSRGEMQRVAVARAMLLSPPIVLADEPTASLDRDAAAIVEHELCTLSRDVGATLVVATHDRALASRMERRIDIVDRGLRLHTPVADLAP